MLAPLPIDPHLPEALEKLRASNALVLQAEPGAGKTTRLPWALLEAGLAQGKEVVVLQPRRLAARLAARRVAEERGERLGETVGFQVRFESVAGPRTRLRFVTEGVLTRRLLADPVLERVGAVVLDEFHERHLDGDLCLALLARLRRERRPDLKIVVMSATLDPAPVAAALGGAPAMVVPGRPHEVAVEHAALPDSRPLEAQVASAVRRLVDEGLDGDVLVFLPGAAEIRRAREALEPLAARADLLVLPLHGELPAAEQDRVVQPARQRKVILSTNVAETSVTIEGVVAVVDSGLARVAPHSAWSGLRTLKVTGISKASAIQRAGRAGRIRAGRCLRLYTRHDFERRPEYEVPEIRRADLSEAALLLHGAGIRDLAEFQWFEAPAPEAIAAAEGLLLRLGAVDERGALTETGRAMLRFPVHPRQARMVLEAAARGHAGDGAVLAALVGEREIRLEARGAVLGEGPRLAKVSGPSDLLECLDLFREAERRGFSSQAMRALGLDGAATQAVARVAKAIGREAAKLGPGRAVEADSTRALLMATLAGFPDRVGRRRRNEQGRLGAELLLVGGRAATLSEQSVVRDAELLVAVDVEERGLGARREARVRWASAVEPEWLLDLFTERIKESVEVVWNSSAERVDASSRLLYEELVIEESRVPAPDPERAAAVLAEAALAKGPRAFADAEELDGILARVAFAREAAPEAGLPEWGEEILKEVLVGLCQGRRSFAELREAGLGSALLGRLSGAQRSVLEQVAPQRVKLASGRQVVVHYEMGRPPWIESRMQDFFGMQSGPAVAGGKVALVLHLLAPNGRAVQVTTDLRGFWQRHYPAIRRELGRRYPRHYWPEDPRVAAPTGGRGRS